MYMYVYIYIYVYLHKCTHTYLHVYIATDPQIEFANQWDNHLELFLSDTWGAH